MSETEAYKAEIERLIAWIATTGEEYMHTGNVDALTKWPEIVKAARELLERYK